MHLLVQKKRATIEKLFDYVVNDWDVYIPLDGSETYLILRTVCASCGFKWLSDEKECFRCKAWYPHAVRCQYCRKIITEENLRKCPFCGKKYVRNCINCGSEGEDVFVPITFCQNCGSRKNMFIFKAIKMEDGKLVEEFSSHTDSSAGEVTTLT